MEQLKEKLLSLKNLDESLKSILKSLSTDNVNDEWNAFWSQAFYIVKLKKEIENEFFKTGIFILDNKDAESILHKIRSKQLFFADSVIRSFERITKTEIDLETRDWSELYEIASNELLSWFGPAEYIARLIEIGVLILDINIPKELERIVEEARRCYGFEQYIAVHFLCRTMLEITMRDIYFRIEKKIPKTLVPSLVSNGDREFKSRIGKLYSRLCDVVHGNKLEDSNGVQSVFRETLMMVEELYQRNRSRF